MPNLRIATLTALLGLALCSCTGIRTRSETAKPPVDGQEVYYGTEVALGQCVITSGVESPLAILGGAFITNAVKGGIDRIGKALTAAAGKHVTKVLAARNLQLTQQGLDSKASCIIIVRGWFYRDPGPVKLSEPLENQPRFSETQARFRNSFVKPDQLTGFWQNRLWLADPPEFIFEGVLGRAKGDQTARFIYPLFLGMEKPFESRFLRPGRERYVNIFFGFEGSEDTLDVELAPGATLSFGRVSPGKPLTYPAPKDLPPGLFKICLDPKEPQECVEAVGTPFESDWFTLDLGEKGIKPYRLKVLVTETQGSSEFLAFIAGVFTGSQTELENQTNALINPVTRAANRAAAAAEKKQARDKLDESLAEALSKLRACADGTFDQAHLASSARKAMRDYDETRRVQGDKPFFGDADFDAIPVVGTLDSIRKGCGATLKKLTG